MTTISNPNTQQNMHGMSADSAYFQSIERAAKAIQEADLIVIGGGSGFSTAAGHVYSGERFTNNFARYIQKYGMTDMYSAGFYPFTSLEEKWGYWARHILFNRYETGSLPLYEQLRELVADKEYFIVTTNVDSLFEKSGFDPERIFEQQGNYGVFQCSRPCTQEVYDNEEMVRAMVAHTDENLRIPSELVPMCPRCGAPLTTHLRIDGSFVNPPARQRQEKRWEEVLQSMPGKKVLLLELGVGFMTPTWIRFPFERITHVLDTATLVRLNRDYPQATEENREKTVSFAEDAHQVLRDLLKRTESYGTEPQDEETVS